MTMYSLSAYGEMIGDSDRFNAYAKAIASAVRPGDAVVEIGCGPGVFSLLACRAGARRVYAIETEDIIHLARGLASANCFADRIEFLQSDSRKTQLPERVNVIVSDIRGALPLLDHAIPSLEDARQRFLLPGGVMIPQRDVLRAALIEADSFYSGLVSPWQNSVRDTILSPALSLLLNRSYTSRFGSEKLLTTAQTWGVLDYLADNSTSAAGELLFHAARSGIAHGVCLWFETNLFQDIGYSSGPGADKTIYGQVFLPWPEPVPLTQGQEVQVGLHADLVGEDYVWRWEVKIPTGGDGAGLQFQQSTLQGALLSPHSLKRRAADFVPTLTEEGLLRCRVFELMDGRASLQEIAHKLAAEFPQRFSSWQQALSYAGAVSQEFSR